MSVDVPSNGIAYRLLALERAIDRLEGLEPAVMKAEIRDVKDDIRQMARDISGLRKLLTGFFITFAFTLLTSVIYILVATRSHP